MQLIDQQSMVSHNAPQGLSGKSSILKNKAVFHPNQVVNPSN